MVTDPSIILHVVRKSFPSPAAGTIMTEIPKPMPDLGPYELRHRTRVYDPRHVIDGNPNIHKVQVILEVYRHYAKKPEGFYIDYCRTIEVLKEYSYEEWDAMTMGDI